ncbi:MAG TPA: LysE family translocator [Pseudonocardiaceae bacterium]|jgi:threonine/homoserine/homoserine lactone efflux protein|nr:LysE family translocator [Pseudonocardiaceae bacterium]
MWSVLGGFVLAVGLGAMVPGPSMALVIRRGAVGGARGTLPVILGMEVGLFAWAVATAVGVSALVKASELAYTGLRIAGAIVLITLGVQAWLGSRHITEDQPFDESAAAGGRRWRPAVSGLLTNLANPKIAVFAFAFYPQFIPLGATVLTTTLLLGAVQVVVDASWFLLVATFIGRARKFFSRAKIRRRLERTTGTVLIGLGAGLALERL